jgi:hypothetical protein
VPLLALLSNSLGWIAIDFPVGLCLVLLHSANRAEAKRQADQWYALLQAAHARPGIGARIRARFRWTGWDKMAHGPLAVSETRRENADLRHRPLETGRAANGACRFGPPAMLDGRPSV